MRKKFIFVLLLFVMVFSIACSSQKKGIMRAEDWQKKHPDIVASYQRNAEMVSTTYGGSEPIDYLEKYPELKVFYDGYGFSKEYLRARGHVYALEDVINTQRPKPGASCFACKSADFIELLNEEGVAVNSMKFEDLASTEMGTISCYDCHTNTPGTIVITREHLNTGLANLGEEHKPGDMVCGQCHVEYYLDPETKEVVLPWHNGLGTDGMLAYYDKIEFKDWVHPTTGTNLLKAQHPEFETFQGSKHSSFGLSCIDCHMPQTESEKGESMRSHHWTSPLKYVEDSCLTCHSNETADSLIAKVEDIQGKVDKKTNEVSAVLLELVNKLTEAVEKKTHSEDVLNQVRDYHRQAQFKWDFVFVENSEGFHHPELAHKNLDEALELAKKGLELLK